MWKGKRVIGGFTDGITVQPVYGVTGFTVNSVEGPAFRIHYLLDNPEIMAKMGQNVKEFVRQNFITRNLGDYLALLAYLQGREESGKSFAISSRTDEPSEAGFVFDTT